MAFRSGPYSADLALMTMVTMFERKRVVSARICDQCPQAAWVATTDGFRCEEHATKATKAGDVRPVCDWVARRNIRR